MNNLTKYAETVAAKELSADYRIRLKRHMSNWIKVSDILYSNVTTEDKVLAMLSYELENRQRAYVIKRIYSRYSNLRMRRETEELQLCLKNLKKTQNDT